jgi:hypothetical protein
MNMGGGGCGEALSWDTALHAGRQQIWFPMVPLGFFNINPSRYTMALRSTQPLTEISAGYISWGVEADGARADYLTTFLCQLYRDPGSLNLLKPWGPIQASNGIAF